jgi:hypothetical protein
MSKPTDLSSIVQKTYSSGIEKLGIDIGNMTSAADQVMTEYRRSKLAVIEQALLRQELLLSDYHKQLAAFDLQLVRRAAEHISAALRGLDSGAGSMLRQLISENQARDFYLHSASNTFKEALQRPLGISEHVLRRAESTSGLAAGIIARTEVTWAARLKSILETGRGRDVLSNDAALGLGIASLPAA